MISLLGWMLYDSDCNPQVRDAHAVLQWCLLYDAGWLAGDGDGWASTARDESLGPTADVAVHTQSFVVVQLLCDTSAGRTEVGLRLGLLSRVGGAYLFCAARLDKHGAAAPDPL